MKREVVVTIAVLILAFPAFAQKQEETFVEIKPGDKRIDPDMLIPLVERGDVRAINNIGLLWARGVGVDKPNFDEALRWWKEAARKGYTVSMNNIGLLYANGHGVKQDYKEAMKWWELAAEHGSAWAMNSIGDLYENGDGVDQSFAEALDWYERAADAGDGLAMYNLAHLNEAGLGVEVNLKSAMDWYERSADKGIGVAMHHLGSMIAEGRGVPADSSEAHAWYSVAAQYFSPEDDDEKAANAKALAELAPKLSPQQLARAHDIATNLQARIEERRKSTPREVGPGESET